MITEAADVLYYYILNEHRDVADLRRNLFHSINSFFLCVSLY